MRPHSIDVPGTSMWVDLDHSLAISDVNNAQHQPMQYWTVRSSFSITMMFLDKPIVVSVHDKSSYGEFNVKTCQQTIIVTFAPPEDIDRLQYEHQKLLKVWKGK